MNTHPMIAQALVAQHNRELRAEVERHRLVATLVRAGRRRARRTSASAATRRNATTRVA